MLDDKGVDKLDLEEILLGGEVSAEYIYAAESLVKFGVVTYIDIVSKFPYLAEFSYANNKYHGINNVINLLNKRLSPFTQQIYIPQMGDSVLGIGVANSKEIAEGLILNRFCSDVKSLIISDKVRLTTFTRVGAGNISIHIPEFSFMGAIPKPSGFFVGEDPDSFTFVQLKSHPQQRFLQKFLDNGGYIDSAQAEMLGISASSFPKFRKYLNNVLSRHKIRIERTRTAGLSVDGRYSLRSKYLWESVCDEFGLRNLVDLTNVYGLDGETYRSSSFQNIALLTVRADKIPYLNPKFLMSRSQPHILFLEVTSNQSFNPIFFGIDIPDSVLNIVDSIVYDRGFQSPHLKFDSTKLSSGAYFNGKTRLFDRVQEVILDLGLALIGDTSVATEEFPRFIPEQFLDFEL